MPSKSRGLAYHTGVSSSTEHAPATIGSCVQHNIAIYEFPISTQHNNGVHETALSPPTNGKPI